MRSDPITDADSRVSVRLKHRGPAVYPVLAKSFMRDAARGEGSVLVSQVRWGEDPRGEWGFNRTRDDVFTRTPRPTNSIDKCFGHVQDAHLDHRTLDAQYTTRLKHGFDAHYIGGSLRDHGRPDARRGNDFAHREQHAFNMTLSIIKKVLLLLRWEYKIPPTGHWDGERRSSKLF